MPRTTTDGDVMRIDLHVADGSVSTTQTMAGQPAVAASVGMTLEQLQRNYNAIVQSKAIYYPVAYQFLREIGRGRQGQVFLGLRHGARGCITEHAIKVFTPDLYRSPEEYWTDMGRIAFQVSKLQRMHGPNLVWTSLYEETYGIGYVQMEAIDGVDLSRLLQNDHLEIARKRMTGREWNRLVKPLFRIEGDRLCMQPGFVVYMMRGALRGLERLHDMGFLHSDVKPGNIMLDRLGGVKLVDFGRAVQINESLAFLLGSPLYMAPECHRRKPSDIRSDLYSLGLVAIELLRGEPVAQRSGLTEEQLVQIKQFLPGRLQDMLPPYVASNRELMQILRRFVEPDPDARFASAREAEVGSQGLLVIEKQLVQANLDTEYERDLADYLNRLVDPKTNRIELPE
jgi:serine/threonine protein kinase